MKNALLISALAGAAMFAATAPANAETYVGVGAAQSQAKVESFNLDDGMSLGAVAGTNVGPLRVEVGIDKVNNDTNLFGLNLNVHAIQAKGDVWFDLPVAEKIAPYFGGGVTYTKAEVGALGFTTGADGFGWEVGAGIRPKITDRITADLGVRYGKSKLNLDFGPDVDVEQTQLRAGLDFSI